ncbi:ATP-binding protein [Archangium sp.]|uniref:ATP-binding protein n=1 Tax=Archangium sp. TaxID=1872627 RepID=UPI002EDA621A
MSEIDPLLRSLIELERSSPDGCIVARAVRDESGTIVDFEFVFVNASADRLLNPSFGTLEGRRITSLASGPSWFARYLPIVETGEPCVMEVPFSKGEYFIRSTMVRFQDGVLSRFVDITNTKRSERERDALLVQEHSVRLEAEARARQHQGELNAVKGRLAQSEKLAVVGQLAAGVGHEINNPLAFVSGNLHVAVEQIALLSREMDGPASERLRETLQALEEARRGAERIHTIVKDLRTLARADETRLVPVDVHAALEFSLTLAMPHLRHKAQVERQLGKVPAVRANEAKLGQVFLNLLINAAQAIPEGDPLNHRVTLVTRLEGTRVVVEVRDTGKGMTPEVMSRIFEPFFTTKAQGEGTGLGLSICQGLIHTMGGEMGVESEPGRGSTFRVVLPMSETDVTATPAPARTVADVQARKRVLVVDDEPGIGSVMRRILGRVHEVIVLQSGREALTLLERDDNFDRVFCDLMMGDMTGMDLHARLAEKGSECLSRFVFMTGGGFTERAREFLQSVSVPRIDKPFEPEVIRSLVAQAPPRYTT